MGIKWLDKSHRSPVSCKEISREQVANRLQSRCKRGFSFISDPIGRRVLSALLITVVCFIMFLLSYCHNRTVATWITQPLYADEYRSHVMTNLLFAYTKGAV